ncbi:uncharacterized protein LOC131225777 isoform X2 [Magnolia sinica]|uniref:uncharacterized protein LOC131225777 isoform X2 n=1 Tax=Magnolia sinica TaxID=86752 RepID=UPI002658BB45|nr:uncharacterized protein LOC131225777 isoform X2 [Magnolia sinica]
MDSIKAPAGRKIPFFLLTIGGPSFPNLFRPFFIVQSTTGCPPIADFGPLKSISSIRPSKIHLISQRCLLPIKTNSRALIAFPRFRNYKRSYKRRSTCILLWQMLLLKLLHLCLILLLRFPPRSCCLTKLCSRS